MKTATPIAHTLPDVELAQLNTLVIEAGSVWELHFERMRTEEPDGESTYRDIWELRPRVTSEATDALTAMVETGPGCVPPDGRVESCLWAQPGPAQSVPGGDPRGGGGHDSCRHPEQCEGHTEDGDRGAA